MANKTRNLGVRLEPETFDRLAAKARQFGHTPSSLTRQLIKSVTAQKGQHMTGAARPATIVEHEFTVDVLQNTDLTGDDANEAAREMMENAG